MSEWVQKASDIEVVEKFQRIHECNRVRSLWCYRMQVKSLYPRLLKILLDGLQRQQETRESNP